jgi:hypothetical protein
LKLALRRAREEDSGRPEDSTMAKTEGATPGQLGRPPAGAGRFAIRRNLQRGIWKTNRRRYRRTERRGNPKVGQSATAEGREIRGNSKIKSPVKPEMQDAGQPEAYIADAAGGTRGWGNSTLRETGNAEGCEVRGDSKFHRRHSQMDRICGATRRFVAGAAEGTRGRGDPETRCWPSRKMQEPRRLGTSSTG